MSDIKFQQAHNLGMDKARELAVKWIDDASKKMGLSCKHVQGQDQDTITFERMGVNGTMLVSGSSFDLNVKLGMMMAAFKPMIESEISKNLGRIIEKASGDQA
jgi:putative polyhydroxyalkanoate system protein